MVYSQKNYKKAKQSTTYYKSNTVFCTLLEILKTHQDLSFQAYILFHRTAQCYADLHMLLQNRTSVWLCSVIRPIQLKCSVLREIRFETPCKMWSIKLKGEFWITLFSSLHDWSPISLHTRKRVNTHRVCAISAQVASYF